MLFPLGETRDGGKPVNNDQNAITEQSSPRERKPWWPPQVILSQLRSTDHDVGKTPNDKITVVEADHPTPKGTEGS